MEIEPFQIPAAACKETDVADHHRRLWFMDSGLDASRRPGMTETEMQNPGAPISFYFAPLSARHSGTRNARARNQ
jgi:hypothetical protein